MHGSDCRVSQPMESNRLRGRWSGGATCATHQKFQRAQKAGVLENVIYSYARSLGYEVSVGCIGMLECDFIMHLSEMGCACMQVAMAIMGDRATEAPEHCLLERIRDSWPKFVITRNATIQHRNGIAYENVTGRSWADVRDGAGERLSGNRPLGSCSYPLLSIQPEGLGR